MSPQPLSDSALKVTAQGGGGLVPVLMPGFPGPSHLLCSVNGTHIFMVKNTVNSLREKDTRGKKKHICANKKKFIAGYLE